MSSFSEDYALGAMMGAERRAQHWEEIATELRRRLAGTKETLCEVGAERDGYFRLSQELVREIKGEAPKRLSLPGSKAERDALLLAEIQEREPEWRRANGLPMRRG